jgi:hypothetical protein
LLEIIPRIDQIRLCSRSHRTIIHDECFLINDPPSLVIEQRGCPDLLISHLVGELNIDDLKFFGDARNSHNHYTTAPMVTNSCVHELASPRRLALANAMRTQARMKKQQSNYY